MKCFQPFKSKHRKKLINKNKYDYHRHQQYMRHRKVNNMKANYKTTGSPAISGYSTNNTANIISILAMFVATYVVC